MIYADYAEYRCSACKKDIKNIAVQCKKCTKLFYHPGCAIKHKVYNSRQELVRCEGPFEEIRIEIEKEETNMRKATGGSDRERTNSIGDARSTASTSGSASKQSMIDKKIEWLVKTVGEMKDEMACKKEIKTIIREIVRSEMEVIIQEFEALKESMKGKTDKSMGNTHRSYANAVSEKKKENIIIVKPKKQQESETTKKLVKEKINITNMAVGITKLKKGNKGTVILGCENEGEMEELKASVQDKLGKDYSIMEPRGVKPKIKIINVGEEEMGLDDENMMSIIMKQNKLEDEREGFHMRVIKKIVKEGRNENTQSGKGKVNGSLILEMDEITHDSMLRREKINIGWRKCAVFDYLSVKRCFKCWGYYHFAKNCTRQITCHKCAGEHKANECMTKRNRCVNCMHKIKTYNLKISDEHDALSVECPTYQRALEEERKRIGMGSNCRKK